jgi:hypothetical protein
VSGQVKSSSYDLEVSIIPEVGGMINGGGMHCPGVCASDYSPGSNVSMTATAYSGHQFSGWIGCDDVMGSTHNTLLNSNKHISANFAT